MAFPAVLFLLLLSFGFQAIKRSLLFLKYGGELISFHSQQKDMIASLMEEFEKRIKVETAKHN